MKPASIPQDDFGGSGPDVHFAHANGYPPGAYQLLLDQITEHYHVYGMLMRPLWEDSPNPELLRDWTVFSDDLAALLHSKQAQGIFGIGHSIGGTITLLAALQFPEFFKKIVLVDPVFFPPWTGFYWKTIRAFNLGYRSHPWASAALRRRRVYPDRESMFTRYRTKTIFSRLSDESLRTYINAATRNRPDSQVELVYTPEWEAEIYLTGGLKDNLIWKNLPTLKPELLVIYGEHSETAWRKTRRLIKKKLPGAEIKLIPGSGHLVPLEIPDIIGREILSFLSQ